MISKIIQKEKDRQEGFFTSIKIFSSSGFADANKGAINQINFSMKMHKEFLINLKEYIEEEVNSITGFIGDPDMFYKISRNISNDIDELTKTIKKYK